MFRDHVDNESDSMYIRWWWNHFDFPIHSLRRETKIRFVAYLDTYLRSTESFSLSYNNILIQKTTAKFQKEIDECNASKPKLENDLKVSEKNINPILITSQIYFPETTRLFG